MHLFAQESINKCNTYFCYSYNAAEEGWELKNFTNLFLFLSYGEKHSEPLKISPEFEDKPEILISIDCNFYSPRFPIKLIIPSTVKYIKQRAFYQVSNITLDLTFDDEVTIEEGAFQEFSDLHSIKFNKNVKKIGEHAFQSCSTL